jgi:hypothetical protein
MCGAWRTRVCASHVACCDKNVPAQNELARRQIFVIMCFWIFVVVVITVGAICIRFVILMDEPGVNKGAAAPVSYSARCLSSSCPGGW